MPRTPVRGWNTVDVRWNKPCCSDTPSFPCPFPLAGWTRSTRTHGERQEVSIRCVHGRLVVRAGMHARHRRFVRVTSTWHGSTSAAISWSTSVRWNRPEISLSKGNRIRFRTQMAFLSNPRRRGGNRSHRPRTIKLVGFDPSEVRFSFGAHVAPT